MGLSIITPHYDLPQGIVDLYRMFQSQTDLSWEWIIVDDCSSSHNVKALEELVENVNDARIKVIFRTIKTNASDCRNQGALRAKFTNLVFLDADDRIYPTFVARRQIFNPEFVVFRNMEICDAYGETQPFSHIRADYLNHFLRARFPWQTTAVLWNREFFLSLGGFNDTMAHFQDVELAIRALIYGKRYKIIENNEVDFQYQVYPIDPKKRPIHKVAPASVQLIRSVLKTNCLNKMQRSYLQSYYFVCVRYWVKGHTGKYSKKLMQTTLSAYKKWEVINSWVYILGWLLINLYSYKLITPQLYLKINRRIFKK